MSFRAWPSLAALALVGCFNPVAAFTGDLPVDGELRIEVQVPAANEQGVAPETFVFLGDGARYLQRLGEDGRAVFSDPSLTGPQDITVVWSYPQDDGASPSGVRVYTALEVNRREVYLEPFFGHPTPVPEKEPVATVTGHVLGLSDEPNAIVVVCAYSGERIYGEWVSRETNGEAFPGGVLEFSMGLTDVPEGPLSFLAHEMRRSDYSSLRAGLVKGVVVGASENAPVDIALAPFATENIKIEARGGAEGRVHASVTARLGRIAIFKRNVSGALPLEVPAISLEGEWAGLERTACLSREMAPGGEAARASAPLGSATTASLDLFEFNTIVEPPITGHAEPPVVAAAEPFKIVWKSDHRADAVNILVVPEAAGATQWQIEAPASRGIFRARPLPDALSHLKLETKGTYWMSFASMKVEKVLGYSARFVRRRAEGHCVAYEGGSHSSAWTSGRFVRE